VHNENGNKSLISNECVKIVKEIMWSLYSLLHIPVLALPSVSSSGRGT